MLCMENEKDFQGPDQLRMRFEGVLIESIKHIKEVFDISQILMRYIVLSTDSMPVGVSSDSRSYSKHSVDLLISEILILINILTS